MATQQSKITAGPGKRDFGQSLLDGKRVTFTVPDLGGPQEVLVTCVETEDGSHQSWNIRGALTAMDWKKFTGYYNTRTRQGFINTEPGRENPERKPAVGDTAYTKHHGETYVGIITYISENGDGVIEPADPSIDWGYNKSTYFIGTEERRIRGLFFGSEEAVVWDPKAGMWYTPADSD